MKILSEEKDKGSIVVTIEADPAEFDHARLEAYRAQSDRYPVPDVPQGDAKLDELQRVYGPAVLYDEALEHLVPESFDTYLKETDNRIFGRPKVDDVSFEKDGSVRFKVTADCFPDIELGQYKGLKVRTDRNKDEVAFEQEVLSVACRQLKGDVPRAMVEQKLDSMIASEKLTVSQDAIYHLLADTLVLLKKGYELAGIARPAEQERAQAMDIMLQTVSFENHQIPETYLVEQIGNEVGRYHVLPDGFEDDMRSAIEERKKQKASMDADERVEEVFDAYLGSIGRTREQYRDDRRAEALREVIIDLLLDAVANAEGIEVSADECNETYRHLAEHYGIELDEAIEAVPLSQVRFHTRQEKAKKVLFDNAITES